MEVPTSNKHTNQFGHKTKSQSPDLNPGRSHFSTKISSSVKRSARKCVHDPLHASPALGNTTGRVLVLLFCPEDTRRHLIFTMGVQIILQPFGLRLLPKCLNLRSKHQSVNSRQFCLL